MSTVSDTDTVEFRREAKGDSTGSAGPIAKIFSIFTRRKQAIPAERRLNPRSLDASRRRALLVAQSRRQK